MEKLDFEQLFNIRGIPVYLSTEFSFRGVFLAGEILALLLHHFDEQISPVTSPNEKSSDNE